MTEDPRRRIPSVDRLLHDPGVIALSQVASRNVVLAAVREAVDAARLRRAGPPDDWALDIAERVRRRSSLSLQPVLNATGVVLHTNLGRAPLAESAAAAIQSVAQGYSTLEYDLAAGVRGHRADHCRSLLAELTGAEDGLAVNNAAGALVLALNAFAATASPAQGGRVLISRGELIEIGGSFRIPEIIEKSGARLHEVGTTNRTHLKDYERVIDGASAILTVHRSNFEQRGFVTAPEPEELAGLAHAHGIPYLYDVGSGLLADLSVWKLTAEPRVPEAVASGADLVIFSGDKLLGGPQAGCLVGTRAAISRCRDNPFARALRADRFSLAALEATLLLYREPERARREIPVLAMLTMSIEDLRTRANRLAACCPPALHPETRDGFSAVGGGSFPGATLPTTLVALDAGEIGADSLALRLRLGHPPVITRVAEGRVVLDPRTLPDAADDDIGSALLRAIAI
ncbi:MAG: L-seryl-tRNA(Sec) selenium transferase [Gemmatimonadota bacterium]